MRSIQKTDFRARIAPAIHVTTCDFFIFARKRARVEAGLAIGAQIEEEGLNPRSLPTSSFP